MIKKFIYLTLIFSLITPQQSSPLPNQYSQDFLNRLIPETGKKLYSAIIGTLGIAIAYRNIVNNIDNLEQYALDKNGLLDIIAALETDISELQITQEKPKSIFSKLVSAINTFNPITLIKKIPSVLDAIKRGTFFLHKATKLRLTEVEFSFIFENISSIAKNSARIVDNLLYIEKNLYHDLFSDIETGALERIRDDLYMISKNIKILLNTTPPNLETMADDIIDGLWANPTKYLTIQNNILKNIDICQENIELIFQDLELLTKEQEQVKEKIYFGDFLKNSKSSLFNLKENSKNLIKVYGDTANKIYLILNAIADSIENFHEKTEVWVIPQDSFAVYKKLSETIKSLSENIKIYSQ